MNFKNEKWLEIPNSIGITRYEKSLLFVLETCKRKKEKIQVANAKLTFPFPRKKNSVPKVR